MDGLLHNPAVQSAVVPFVCAIVLAIALKRFGWIWAGIGLLVGIYSCVWLAFGLDFTPLTSTRKIFILGIVAFALGLSLDLSKFNHKWLVYFLGLLSAIGSAWIVWRYAMRKEGFEPWLIVISCMAYSAFIVIISDHLRTQSEKGLPNILMLATATSICAVLGASASLGQLSGAIAAASGAYFLLHLIQKNVTLPRNLNLTACAMLGFIGIAAVIYAKLPWYVLLLLGGIPVILLLPLRGTLGKLPKVILQSLYTLPVVAAAIVITLQVSGAPPY